MASIRFRYFAMKVLLIILVLRSTIAYHQEEINKIVVEAPESGFEEKERSDMKENIDLEIRSGKIGGRKMMIEERKLRKIRKQEEEIVCEEASKNPGANNFDGNCDLKVKGLKMNTKLRGRSIHGVNVQKGSFMVFNADYHMAKPHPPKNN